MLRIGIAAAACLIAAAQAGAGDSLQVFFQQHCLDCHSSDSAEGEIDLTDVNRQSLLDNAKLIRQLIDALDTQQMPPEEEPQPDLELRRQTVQALQTILHQAVANSQVHTRTPLRRMNRFQYNNAVVDLFDLDCTVFTLPERAMRIHQDYFHPESGKMPDTVAVGNRPLGKSQLIEPRLAGVAAFPQDLRAEHGYDNRADHLSLSPLLMNEFLQLGQSITQSPDFNPRRVGIWNSFFAPPDHDADWDAIIRQRLEPFLTKAFRRPIDPDWLERYASFGIRLARESGDFTEAMKSLAAAAIASPSFLYLYDRQSEDQASIDPQPIDDFELASRLSFFLWGSLPDETLLSLAADGLLGRPEILNQQIDRMLKDRKLKRFCDSFPTQWLQLDRIVSSVPNRKTFPDFYFSKYRASMHMMMEPLLLFETVLIEDLPITQLIDPDFSYRSTKLEFIYGSLAGDSQKPAGGSVTVLNFRRVPITDRRTGGVITNAAVMTMTAGTDRTKPITRGAWIAAVIFNDPPEPPPADVPPLSEKPDPNEENLTLRERLTAHRERADCRGCHEQIDPLGFALENYDPIGRWRETYPSGLAVDVSGQLFRRHKFDDVVGFKDAILAEKERFCRALAAHLMAFGLARKLSPADQIAVDEIAAAVAEEDYKIQTMIRELIHSQPFQTK